MVHNELLKITPVVSKGVMHVLICLQFCCCFCLLL